MDSSIVTELFVIGVLILANSFFAGAEIAIIAARKGRLRAQADAGDQRAKAALELAGNPDRFLPTVQVGITVIGTFAAVFSGARLVDELSQRIKSHAPWEGLARQSQTLAMITVVLGISFLSVVVGELAPKRFALHHAQSLARHVALPVLLFARVFRPFVWFLARATDLVLWPTGVRRLRAPTVSIEDIKYLIDLGAAEGVVDPMESRLAFEALRLGDRRVKDVMRPRIEIDAVEVDTPTKEVLGTLAMAGFSRLPIYEDDLDHIIGYIHLKDVLRQQYLGWRIDLRKLLKPALFVPENLKLDKLLVLFQEQKNHLAIVVDEFGGTEGMVTIDDVVAELVGAAAESALDDQQKIVRRDPTSWLLDGSVGIDDMVAALNLKPSQFPQPRDFSTVAGLVLECLKRIPNVGDVTHWKELRLEVVDMDGPRIDRILVSYTAAGAPTVVEPKLTP